MSTNKQLRCKCNAYQWPHNLNVGQCDNTSMRGPFCTACGCTCHPIKGDNGIGSYEFWGARGFDSRVSWDSDCCDAPVSEDQDGCKKHL